jgi:hypothetical protein
MNVNLSYDEVWNRIIRFFGELGIPIKNMDKASGFIYTEVFSMSGQIGTFMDCGVPGDKILAKGIFEDPTGHFNVVVTRISENVTNVKINSFFRTIYAIYASDGYGGWRKNSETSINCNSMGVLEEVFLKAISK